MAGMPAMRVEEGMNRDRAFVKRWIERELAFLLQFRVLAQVQNAIAAIKGGASPEETLVGLSTIERAQESLLAAARLLKHDFAAFSSIVCEFDLALNSKTRILEALEEFERLHAKIQNELPLAFVSMSGMAGVLDSFGHFYLGRPPQARTRLSRIDPEAIIFVVHAVEFAEDAFKKARLPGNSSWDAEARMNEKLHQISVTLDQFFSKDEVVTLLKSALQKIEAINL